LQGAIDFAEAADAVLEAWQALHLSLTFSKLSGTHPACHIAAHRAAFSAICKLQLILRRLRERSWRRGKWWGLGFKRQPRIPPRNPPRTFFYKCILQAAIDFAEAAEAELELRSGMECRTFFGVAGFAHEPNF